MDRRYSDPRIALLFFSFSNKIYYYGNVLKGVEKMIGRKLLGVDFFSFNFDAMAFNAAITSVLSGISLVREKIFLAYSQTVNF